MKDSPMPSLTLEERRPLPDDMRTAVQAMVVANPKTAEARDDLFIEVWIDERGQRTLALASQTSTTFLTRVG